MVLDSVSRDREMDGMNGGDAIREGGIIWSAALRGQWDSDGTQVSGRNNILKVIKTHVDGFQMLGRTTGNI